MKHKHLRTMRVYFSVYNIVSTSNSSTNLYLPSPQCPYEYFGKKFDELMKDYYDVTYPMIIMGDFNMKSITGLEMAILQS